MTLFFRTATILAASLPLIHAAQDPIQPFLTAHCLTCHNDQLKVASLSLSQSPADPALRQKILDKITTGRMPPPGAPNPPTSSEIAAITAALQTDSTPAPDKNRLTAHRLNRAEYNNTIRDLLGLNLHPADQFPLDDAGYGFDNIGDVLSVSPLLMEKYAAAARAISQAAVYGEPAPAKPTKLIRFLGKKSQDDPTPNALPFSLRGALWATYNFPVNGEYEFRLRVANYRPRKSGAYPSVGMAFQLDGKTIYTEIVDGDIDAHYAHGESVARATLQAGEHTFRAEFPAFNALATPLDNMNKDGRRKLFTDYIDIVGPFNPSSHPPATRARLFVCDQKTPACARAIVANLERRAYRRPPTSAEIDEIANLAALVRKAGKPFDESIRVALQAVLTSPNFLFRIDNDSDYARASRLSYFLWSSMPDEQLLRAAERHQLNAEVPRMLADPRSEALIDNFVAQWLGLRGLDHRKPDPQHFPLVDDELLDAMRRETTLFARAILRENRGIYDFLDGPFTYVNGPLALYYGMPAVTPAADFQRVELDGAKRGGVITQASILTLSSYATRTSPVLRGKWVLENMLGTAPPPPPPDVPALPEQILGKDASVRRRLEQHRANPACAVCHNQMDPIGFGLENYDAAGAWRDREGNFPIEGPGPQELKRDLRKQSGQFARNLTEKLLTYALGRGLEPYDRATVDKIDERAAANGFGFSTLVMEVINAW